MRLEFPKQRAGIFGLRDRVGAASQQFQKSPVAAERAAHLVFDLREHGSLLGESREVIGELRIRRRAARGERALGLPLFHLQAAEEISLRLLRAARERPQEQSVRTLRAIQPPLVDGANPRRLRRAARIHLRDLRGEIGFDPVQRVPILPVRLTSPRLEFARDLILLLRKVGDRPPELRQEFETPAHPEIEAATHSRPRPF